MLERLHEQKQRQDAEDEKRRARALVEKREEMKRVLGQQLKDKEVRAHYKWILLLCIVFSTSKLSNVDGP